MIAPGYFACHFASVRSGFSALSVNKLPAPITPGLQVQEKYALALSKE